MNVDLPSLLGVWTRRWIRRPGEPEDSSTRVFWLQGYSWFGDVRFPAPRPSFAGVTSRRECSAEQSAYLDRQEGFCGELKHVDDAWLWERGLDYQSPTGHRDIGRLAYQDNSRTLMLEEGVDAPYSELWERIDDGESKPPRLLRMESGGGDRGILMTVGRHFLLFVVQPDATPIGCEISHGLWKGQLSSWKITDSTHPWREEQPVLRPWAEPWTWSEDIQT